MEINKIYNEDCIAALDRMPDNFVDLIVTSPPYDNLRTYEAGQYFSFDHVAIQMLRVLKDGGICVWVVGDSRTEWNKSLTSFKQAVAFQMLGFKVPDVIIYQKDAGVPLTNWYSGQYEFMLILLKGKKPKTINLLKEKSAHAGKRYGGRRRNKSGGWNERPGNPVPEYIPRSNIWKYNTGFRKSTKDKIAHKHPATFPEKLASDCILSWSNEGDLVYDPFMGSGTTAKMARYHNRNYIGSEISAEYCRVAEERLKQKVLL